MAGSMVKKGSVGVLLAAVALWLNGCTTRAVTVTSVPEGATVTVNNREVGKTPVRVHYTRYGKYRVELRKEKFQTIIREEKLNPPWYGYDPIAFFADNVIPARVNDETYLHYVMEPVAEKFDQERLMTRAKAARVGKVLHPESGKLVEVEIANPEGLPVVEPLPDRADIPDTIQPDPRQDGRLPVDEMLDYEAQPIEDPEKKTSK
jgi:hypothetical protein